MSPGTGTCVYLLDVPENTPVVDVAGRAERTTVARVGPYFRVTSPDDIVIDRRATGVRHAVWYSCIAGLTGSRITQWDKDALRIRASADPGE